MLLLKESSEYIIEVTSKSMVDDNDVYVDIMMMNLYETI